MNTIDELMLELRIYHTINLCVKNVGLDDIIERKSKTLDELLSMDAIVD